MARALLRRRAGIVAAALFAVLVPASTAGLAQSPSPQPTPALLWASQGDPDDPMQNTGDVTIAPDGRIWVADVALSRFGIFEPDGTFVEYWSIEKDEPGEFALHRPNGD